MIRSPRAERYWSRRKRGVCVDCETPVVGRARCPTCAEDERRRHVGKGNTRCSACGERGHNRRACRSAAVTAALIAIVGCAGPDIATGPDAAAIADLPAYDDRTWLDGEVRLGGEYLGTIGPCSMTGTELAVVLDVDGDAVRVRKRSDMECSPPHYARDAWLIRCVSPPVGYPIRHIDRFTFALSSEPGRGLFVWTVDAPVFRCEHAFAAHVRSDE